jgi:hypothetical protein
MNNTTMPPIPTDGPQSCATVRLYLAVLSDLPAEQVRALFQHVDTCAGCAAELRLLTQATQLVTNLAELAPPPSVDRAVMAAIAARSRRCPPELGHPARSHRTLPTHRTLWLMGQVAAALMLLAFLSAHHFLSGPLTTSQTFVLPASLSWSGYVLYYSETKLGANGMRYRINCYHDLGTGRMHVETITGGGLDIVAVGNEQVLLGEDLVHHIAQWGVNAWSVDDSLFNLAQLRSDLEAKRAVYLGTDHFDGQEVYRIGLRNGLVLLLDRHYLPVNVLRNAHGPGTGEPIYETLTFLPASQVPSTLWDTNVPPGFQMGRLPERP